MREHGPGVFSEVEVERFVEVHQRCGELTTDTEDPTPGSYVFWMICSCGAELRRWVTPDEAEDDLLWSGLTAFPN
jgi:hypothetical protein